MIGDDSVCLGWASQYNMCHGDSMWLNGTTGRNDS